MRRRPDEGVRLTMKDKQRIEVTQAVTGGRVTVEQAMVLVERSRRTVYRWQALLREEGLSGLVHGNRGQPSALRTPEQVRRRVVELARTKYADVNDTHLRELLAEREGIELGRETLRGILRAAGCARALGTITDESWRTLDGKLDRVCAMLHRLRG